MTSASTLSVRYLHNETAAYAHLESILWPEGPVCPHCGPVSGKHYDLRKTRIGLRKCSDCRKQFTVKVATVFESAHIPLHKMLQAVYLLCSSNKGVSSHQLHRILGIQHKSAWFLSHRIREAFRSAELAPMGGGGGIVEVDETFIGQKEDMPKRRGFAHKHAVLSLVERGGTVRSFHVDGTSAAHLVPILRANIAKETAVMTDEAGQYTHSSKDFASHDYVNHGTGEYGRGKVHEHSRGLLQYFQVRHEGCLSTLRRTPFASLRCGVRFPLQ